VLDGFVEVASATSSILAIASPGGEMFSLFTAIRDTAERLLRGDDAEAGAIVLPVCMVAVCVKKG